ncbi:MAG: hypothetical protein JWN34_34 [Bryobacterales bacterium]|nr:hypothetical protein [Bryobacterales bacterium]
MRGIGALVCAVPIDLTASPGRYELVVGDSNQLMSESGTSDRTPVNVSHHDQLALAFNRNASTYQTRRTLASGVASSTVNGVCDLDNIGADALSVGRHKGLDTRPAQLNAPTVTGSQTGIPVRMEVRVPNFVAEKRDYSFVGSFSEPPYRSDVSIRPMDCQTLFS